MDHKTFCMSRHVNCYSRKNTKHFRIEFHLSYIFKHYVKYEIHIHVFGCQLETTM